jgi:hypothetical protein
MSVIQIDPISLELAETFFTFLLDLGRRRNLDSRTRL